MSIYSLKVINLQIGAHSLRKEFTSFDVAAVVCELKEVIIGSHVNNVYQLDTKTLLLKLHKTDKPAFRLVLEAGRRLHLTSYELEKPSMPPAFCMALRKYLRNSWLTNVEQYEFERVIIFSFKIKGSPLQLVLELFGDGNIILLDEKNKILHALLCKRMRDRNIIRNEPFMFAPSSGKNPSKINREELQEGLKDFGDVEVVRAIARFLSIGGVYAEETLAQAGVDKTKLCKILNEGEIDAIFDCLNGLLSQLSKDHLKPCVVLDNAGAFVDVVPFKLRRYEGFACQTYGSFNDALDEFFVRAKAVEKASAGIEVNDLRSEAERLGRIIADQKKVLAESEAKAEEDKRVGDVIYAHSGELHVLLDRFLKDRQSEKEWNTIVSEVLAEKKTGLKPWGYFESFDAKGLMVNVCIDGLAFDLNLRKGIFENAAEFYERSKRNRQKLAGAKSAFGESRRKLDEVEAEIGETEKVGRSKPVEAMEELARRKVKHKEWFEKFRWFVSSDGFLVVTGKDATSNEVLVKKYAEADDLVFHADVVGAPFVVVKTENKKPSEQCLHEVGEFAAAFSRGWREGFGSVDVYWVKPEQLSKSASSGEFVGHGAFVVRGERNWMRGTALKLAIGVVDKNGEITFIGGPVNAVKAKTDNHVLIVPGDLSGQDLCKRVLGFLSGKMSKELREKVLKVSVEKIREFIPYNKGRILDE